MYDRLRVIKQVTDNHVATHQGASRDPKENDTLFVEIFDALVAVGHEIFPDDVERYQQITSPPVGEEENIEQEISV